MDDIYTHQLLAPTLQDGEHLLWAGRPRQGLVLWGNDVLMIPFNFLWCGFALFCEWSAIKSGAPLLFVLLGVPFVLMGLYATVGHFFFDARLRASTLYAITDQRVLITSGVFRQTTTSLPLDALPEVRVSEGRGGEGSITFGYEPGRSSVFGRASLPGPRRNAPPAFDMIADVQSVASRLRQAQAAMRARR